MATPAAPGPQTPGKYPVQVGPKYQYYGEQPGWKYDPYTDSYLPDPESQREFYEEQGLAEPEPEPPGLAEQLTPVVAGGAALLGGRYLANRYLPQVADAIEGGASNLFGGGGIEADVNQALTNDSLFGFGQEGIGEGLRPDIAPSGQETTIITDQPPQGGVLSEPSPGGGDIAPGDPNVASQGADPQMGGAIGAENAGLATASVAGGFLGLKNDWQNPDHSVGRAAGKGALKGGAAGWSFGGPVGAIAGAGLGAFTAGLSAAAQDTERVRTIESMLSSPMLRQQIPELDMLTQDQQRAAVAGLMDAGLLMDTQTTGDKREDLSKWRYDGEFWRKEGSDAKYKSPPGPQIRTFIQNPKDIGSVAKDQLDSDGSTFGAARASRSNQQAWEAADRLREQGYPVPMTTSSVNGETSRVPDIERALMGVPLAEQMRLLPEYFERWTEIPEIMGAIQGQVKQNVEQGVSGEPPPPIDSGKKDAEGNPVMRQPNWTPGEVRFNPWSTEQQPPQGPQGLMGGNPPGGNPNLPPPTEQPPQGPQAPQGMMGAPEQGRGGGNGAFVPISGQQVKPEIGGQSMLEDAARATLPQTYDPGINPARVQDDFQHLYQPMNPEMGSPNQGGKWLAGILSNQLGRQVSEDEALQIMKEKATPYAHPPQQRSSTLSPGIGLDGKPISRGMM